VVLLGDQLGGGWPSRVGPRMAPRSSDDLDDAVGRDDQVHVAAVVAPDGESRHGEIAALAAGEVLDGFHDASFPDVYGEGRGDHFDAVAGVDGGQGVRLPSYSGSARRRRPRKWIAPQRESGSNHPARPATLAAWLDPLRVVGRNGFLRPSLTPTSACGCRCRGTRDHRHRRYSSRSRSWGASHPRLPSLSAGCVAPHAARSLRPPRCGYSSTSIRCGKLLLDSAESKPRTR
jgi:hypothetical protein